MSTTGKTGVTVMAEAIPGKTRPSGRFRGWLVLLAVPAVYAATASRAADITPSLERAAALRADGKFDEALDVLRAASREVKKNSGEESLLLLPINDMAADILIDKGAIEAAEPLLTKVIATRQKLVDSGRPVDVYATELVSSLMTLVRLQVQAKRFPDAAATAQRALLLQDRTHGPEKPFAATIRATLESVLESLDDFLGPADKAALHARDASATVFTSLGLFRAAIEQRRKVLAGTLHRGDDAAADSFSAAERLCRLMMATGLAAEAIPIAEEAVQRVTAASAPISHAGIRLLGELQLADGRLISADTSFKAVADAIQKTKSATPLASSNDRLRCLLIDVRRGQVTTLPGWFEAELKLLGAATPSDRETAAAAVATAAEVLAARDDHAAAADLLRRAAALAASAKTPSAATAAELGGRLAAAEVAAGRPTAAFVACKAALAAADTNKLGPGDPAVAFLRVVLADTLRRKGEGEAAAKMLVEALARELPRPDDGSEAVIASVVDELAAARPDEPIRDLFIASRERQFGEGHRHVGTAWNLMASSRLVTGDWSTAADFLDRGLAIHRTCLGADHPEIAATTALLASAQLAAGDPARATATATEAVEAWERLAGNGHPGTLAAIEVLARARLQSGQRDAAKTLYERLCGNGQRFSDVKQADHLVRLATLVLPRDRGRAEETLARVARLPCWLPDGDVHARDRPAMAITAARVAHAFKQLGQPDEAAEAVRKARSWASTSTDATQLLDQVERVADSGDLPPES